MTQATARVGARIFNLPNILTFGRVLFVPLVVACLFWPDAARAAIEELGVTGVTVASIAKGVDRNAGRETFFLPGREPFRLAPRDPALYFVQRLRDEAHRFAIGTHRAKRKKEFAQNPLDEIAGIGPTRKRALLQAFGTAKAVAGAALADLEKTPGFSSAMAKLVFDHFHDKA